MRNWFKKHKAVLTFVAVLVGGPTAGIYIQATDAALDAAEVLTAEPEQEQASGISDAN